MALRASLLAIAKDLITLSLLVFTGGEGTPPKVFAQEVLPVLEFPQQGLDDTLTYKGYATRFFRDSDENAVQISINQNTGRVVHLCADGANESIAFTVRADDGAPGKLRWASPSARVSSEGQTRYVEYALASESSSLDIGLFFLGSMRIERDYQYAQKHMLPFSKQPVFVQEELVLLIRNIEKLPNDEQQLHLKALGANNTVELRARLRPNVTSRQNDLQWSFLVEQPTFDGKNHLSLELSADLRQVTYKVFEEKIFLRSVDSQPLRFTVKIGTDSSPLTPLKREQIFNSSFLCYYERAKVKYDSLVHRSSIEGNASIEEQGVLQFKRLERQMRGLELLSYQEKLMAGLPNFATYFGRDMMMSALMMEPIWTSSMLEHSITSVLRKLSPRGEVSHEEALGGQAVRENAVEYNKLLAEYFRRRTTGDIPGADSALSAAGGILRHLQTTRENYKMVDDDFQLPVLAARYLSMSDVPVERKRKFLLGSLDSSTILSRLVLNLMYVAEQTQAYVEGPTVENLVSFPKLDERRWFPGSWRDSQAGYANGRFAMDVNAIWIPKALEATGKILATLSAIGFTTADLESNVHEMRSSKLAEYAHHPETLQRAITIWRNARRHFHVRLSTQELQRSIKAKLDWFAEEERAYWANVVEKNGAENQNLEFLCLSLDEKGQPIPVMNTDPATLLFLENFTDDIINGKTKPEEVTKLLRNFLLPYPIGLFVDGLGPLVANDIYASHQVWENYARDAYHSPRVVWGREVNLLLLGIAKQILAAFDSEGKIKNQALASYVHELRDAFDKTLAAVESSGLKHNELWSYRIERGHLLLTRYGTSSDIQLWNLTDLAVQFYLNRIRGLTSG